MRGSTPKLVNNNNSPNHENLLTMHRALTIVTPQRSNSLDYLNFEEKRQLIASSLSLSMEILQCGPAAAAAHAAKEIAETAVIGKFRMCNIQMILDYRIIQHWAISTPERMCVVCYLWVCGFGSNIVDIFQIFHK